MVLRSNKSQRAYRKHRQRPDKPACDFCALNSQHTLYESETLAVIGNLFPYAMWDFCRVQDHLLVVPKIHVESIDELPDRQRQEYFEVVSKYEGLGYNFYGRSAGAASKSLMHQHTHLIRIEPKFIGPLGIVWAYVGDDLRAAMSYPKHLTAAAVQRLQKTL